MHHLLYVHYTHADSDASVEDLSPWPKILCEFIFTEELKALEAWFKEVIFPHLRHIDNANLPLTLAILKAPVIVEVCENAAFQMTSFLARCTFRFS